MFSQKITQMRLQQVIIAFLGLLSIAVILTSCSNAESCSAYQEVEIPAEWNWRCRSCFLIKIGNRWTAEVQRSCRPMRLQWLRWLSGTVRKTRCWQKWIDKKLSTFQEACVSHSPTLQPLELDGIPRGFLKMDCSRMLESIVQSCCSLQTTPAISHEACQCWTNLCGCQTGTKCG